jgi:catecholate siderophore receptor
MSSGWCTSVQNPNREWTGSISTEGADRYNTKTKSTSIYLLDNIEFSPQWILDLGLRWDDYSEQTMTYGARNSAVIANPATAKAGDKVKIENDLIFQLSSGLVYKPVENGSIYASYATSSNPVGVDGGDGSEGITAAIQNLKPEEVVLLKSVQNGT